MTHKIFYYYSKIIYEMQFPEDIAHAGIAVINKNMIKHPELIKYFFYGPPLFL